MRPIVKLSTLGILLLLVTFDHAVGQRRRTTISAPSAPQTNGKPAELSPAMRRKLSFEQAWSIIDQYYFDETFSGLDWNKIKREYAPRVAAAKTDAAFHRILEQMVARLGKSHLEVLSPDYFQRLETAKKTARIREKQIAADEEPTGEVADDDEEDEIDAANLRFGIGVELRLIGDQFVITHVGKQSGAANAGLKTGYVIDKVNGVSLSKFVEQAVIKNPNARDLKQLLAIEIVTWFLNGEQESSVFLSVLDEANRPKEVTVPRLRLGGEAVSLGSNLPDQFLSFESASLSPDVGYIKFNSFAVPVIEKFCNALSDFGSKKAIIVDLRGNLGGIMGTMIGLAGMVTDKTVTLGTTVSRSGRSPFVAHSKVKNFKGKLVVLVDGLSMSAAELFTAGLHGNDRAIVVGERTGGQALPAVWTKLLTGAVLMYPMADFITPGGASLEGSGLVPDLVVPLDRKSLIEGRDVQLEKGLQVATGAMNVAKAARTVISSVGGPNLPPPPPLPAKLTVLGTVNIAAPVVKPTPTPTSDAKSLATIARAVAAAGGADALARLTSYEGRGSATFGTDGEGGGPVYVARQSPDKILVEMTSPQMGEVRTVFNGADAFIQSDLGIEQKLASSSDAALSEFFAPYFLSMDLKNLTSLKFEGEYPVDGRMRDVFSATGPMGLSIGLSFDRATKLPVTYSMPGFLWTMADYRKINGVMLPFRIELDRVMTIQLDTMTVNSKIDPAVFEKKQKRFDRKLEAPATGNKNEKEND